jgi:beta-glucanase (GH16 family)
MMTKLRLVQAGIGVLMLGWMGCAQPEVTSTGRVVKDLPPATTGTIEVVVDIPVAGRYQVAVVAKNLTDSTGTWWLEDYMDNPDNRTYDVTGPVEVPAGSDWSTLSRDGSPLNAGVHNMRLHLGDTPIEVKQLTFELLRPHRLTPDTLVQETSGSEWSLVWSDEFEGSGAVDTTKWTFDIGNWGWGNKELQYYTENRTENARREDGSLVIEARKNDMGQPWTSARLTTRGKVTFLYGKIEIRAKVPLGRGTWAAGWTLGDAYVDELSWPYCGEIDILETVGYEMDTLTGNGKAHATIHCGAYYFKLGNQPTSILPVERIHQEFHTYAIEWTPNGIRAFVDDQQYFEYTDTTTPLAWPYDQPQNLILNLAMGGDWGGLMGVDERLEKEQYIVDYVRVFERK